MFLQFSIINIQKENFMKVILIMSVFASYLAQAHIYEGEYRGITQGGEECGFIIEKIEVHNNVRHPLNQVLKIKYQEEIFNLRVKNNINPNSTKISYDPTKLIDAKASRKGEKAFILDLHPASDNKHHGPSNAIFFSKNYDNNITKKIKCMNIRYQW